MSQFHASTRKRRTRRPVYSAWLDVCVLAVLTVSIFATPSMAYGRSVGPWAAFTIACALALVTIFVGIGLRLALPRAQGAKGVVAFLGLHLVLSAGAYSGTLTYAQLRYHVADRWVETKIEYFCLEQFRPETCAQLVNTCPECALKIDKWKRDRMRTNLLALQRTPASQIKRNAHAAR